MTIESDADETFKEVNRDEGAGIVGGGDGSVKDDESRVNRIDENVKEREEDGIVGDGAGSFREDESLINRTDENVNDGERRVLQGQGVQQEAQGSVVRWQRFLHVPSIRVLLVEYDDSTRNLVTALLRNSNYDVVEAANGLEAWKHLEDLNNHIDIVLTEIVMPSLSGIVLLCKIMSHNTRKNIPVIMMSSLDSMALVFKCLSKGAVDFLVKPIRKNELKNLWQHIWRRCRSSSGSGSESGAQTQKSVKSKSGGKSDDNSSHNDSDDNENEDLKVCDGSEDGSRTQSSWTSQDVEVDSSPAVSQGDCKSVCPESTCALVVSTNPEISGNKRVPMTATKESQEQEESLDNVAKSKELAISEPRNYIFQTGSPFEPNIHLQLDSTPNSERLDEGPGQCSGDYPLNKHKALNMPGSQINNKIIKEPTNALEINIKSIDEPKDLPSIELSLKRVRGVEDTSTPGGTVEVTSTPGETVQSDRNVSRRLEFSSFSRSEAKTD